MYYDHKTKLKDSWLEKQDVDYSNSNMEYYYEKFLAKSYLNKSYLFCWIDKFTLTKRILNLTPENRTWHHGLRDFWVCPLQNSLPPHSLIEFLKRF